MNIGDFPYKVLFGREPCYNTNIPGSLCASSHAVVPENTITDINVVWFNRKLMHA